MQCTYFDVENDKECFEEGIERPECENRVLCDKHYKAFLPQYKEWLESYVY